MKNPMSRVLLIAPKYFGYERNILDELKKKGYLVTFLYDRPFASPLIKLLVRIFPKSNQFLVHCYYMLFKKEHLNSENDIVLVVEGITLHKMSLAKLKKSNPSAKFILYVWDSIINKPHIYDNVSFYDSVITFDPSDAKKYGFIYRPLFFSNDFSSSLKEPRLYDFTFIGTMHSDRYKVIRSIVKYLSRDLQIYLFMYMHAKWYYHLISFFDKSYNESSVDEFKFDPLPRKNVSDIIKKSRIIIDIEHPNQKGLTIRTFEAFGARTKLVTTNSSVKNHDFFNLNNIYVIDRNNLEIPEDFLNSPYVDLPEHLYNKYSIGGWLDEILSISIQRRL